MFGELVDYGHVFSKQYMYVIARLSSLRIPGYDPSTAIQFPKSFAQTAMAPLETDTGASAVWGGASKGAIFCLLKSRSGHSVDYVIDINPSKQGKYLPATGIQISSPEYALKRLPPGSTIYVMNSKYSDEIRAMSNNAFRYIEIDHE